MLTLNGGLQAAAVILAVVLASLSLGFWIGFRFAQRRPRLGAFLGVIAIAAFTLGPMGVLAATFKCTLAWCIASGSGWLVLSGVAWGCVMSDFGRGKRDSRNISFLQTMYLVGCGSVLTGLLVNLLNYVPGAGAEDMQVWTRQVGLFSITTMVYMTLGSFVFWMFLWQRAALVKATPLAPDEKFLEEGDDADVAAATAAKPPVKATGSAAGTPVGVSGMSYGSLAATPEPQSIARDAHLARPAVAADCGSKGKPAPERTVAADDAGGATNEKDKPADEKKPVAADGSSGGAKGEPPAATEAWSIEAVDLRTKKLS